MICYRARWVLPISARPLEHAVVAVEHGRIAYVGPPDAAPAAETRDLGHAILMPGLVNAHTHLELTVLRGFLENHEFAKWIARLQAVKGAVLDRAGMLDSARLGILEGLGHGVTTYADTCDSGVAFDAMLEAGVRGVMFQEVFGPDPRDAAASLAGLAGKVDTMRPRETALVTLGVSPHAPYTVSDALYRAVADYATGRSLPLACHIAEGQSERELVEQGGGVFADALRRRSIAVARRARSSIDLLDATGVLACRPLLIHCVRVDDGDLDRITNTKSSVAHCPVSNARLGHGVAPVLHMLDGGIRVGLGSDSMASNNQMDLLAEARAASLAQGAASGRNGALSADAALRLATLGGAEALGLADEIGSLAVGKAADLAAFPVSDERGPVQDPAATAVFSLPGTQASLVIVAGRELVRDGHVLQRDPALPARIDAVTQGIWTWAARE